MKKTKELPPEDLEVSEDVGAKTPDKDSEQDAAIEDLKARVDAAEAKLAEKIKDPNDPTVGGSVNQDTAETKEDIGEEEYTDKEGSGQGSVPTYAGKESEGPAPEPENKKELPV